MRLHVSMKLHKFPPCHARRMEEPAEEGAKLHQFLGASQNPKATGERQGEPQCEYLLYCRPDTQL